MVRQVLPAVAVRTLEAHMLCHVCLDGACDWSQVNVRVNDYSDGTSVLAYHDANDPMRNVQISITDQCQRDVLVAMLEAIALLAPEQP